MNKEVKMAKSKRKRLGKGNVAKRRKGMRHGTQHN
jgi:hypothetical protein